MRVSFATVLILAGVLGDCPAGAASGGIPPLQEEAIERCVDARSADLQSIRDKADVARTAVDGAPPVEVSLNDAFPTDAERPAIAHWFAVRHHCRRRAAIPQIHAAAPADAISAASSQQAAALERILAASVDHLIRSLYCRALTYGFIRRAAELTSSIQEAGTQRDADILRRPLRQLVYFKLSCSVYLRRLDTRQPGTVHNRGALYT